MKKTTIFVSATVATLSIITCMGFAAASGIQGDNLNAHAIAEELVFTKENFTNKFITNGVGYEINFDVQGETNPDTTGILGLKDGAVFLNTTKISGIETISTSYESGNEGKLVMRIGYDTTLGADTTKKTITHENLFLESGKTFSFIQGKTPSFIEIKADKDVDINGFKITYSCQEIVLPEAAAKDWYIAKGDELIKMDIAPSSDLNYFQHSATLKLTKDDVIWFTDNVENKDVVGGFDKVSGSDPVTKYHALSMSDANKIKVERAGTYTFYWKSNDEVWLDYIDDIKATGTYYLDAGVWKTPDNAARFAAYFIGVSKSQWVDMTFVEGTEDIYQVITPEGTWEHVIFARMKKATTENNWDNRYNQTGDINFETGKNLYSIANWENNGNSWGTYNPVGK